jgi:hypothetical protein
MVYTIYFKQSTIASNTPVTANDVLVKYIRGTHDIVFATTRHNISVAVYNAEGHMLFHENITPSSQNDIYLITDAHGLSQLVDVYAPTTTFTVPKANQFYFYVFYQDGKTKIKSGKMYLHD